MAKVSIHKVSALPANLDNDALYIVEDGSSDAVMYVTSSTGVAHRTSGLRSSITTTTAISDALNAEIALRDTQRTTADNAISGEIAGRISAVASNSALITALQDTKNQMHVVADEPARVNIGVLQDGDQILVLSSNTVTPNGFAMYVVNNGSHIKTSDVEQFRVADTSEISDKISDIRRMISGRRFFEGLNSYMADIVTTDARVEDKKVVTPAGLVNFVRTEASDVVINVSNLTGAGAIQGAIDSTQNLNMAAGTQIIINLSAGNHLVDNLKFPANGNSIVLRGATSAQLDTTTLLGNVELADLSIANAHYATRLDVTGDGTLVDNNLGQTLTIEDLIITGVDTVSKTIQLSNMSNFKATNVCFFGMYYTIYATDSSIQDTNCHFLYNKKTSIVSVGSKVLSGSAEHINIDTSAITVDGISTLTMTGSNFSNAAGLSSSIIIKAQKGSNVNVSSTNFNDLQNGRAIQMDNGGTLSVILCTYKNVGGFSHLLGDNVIFSISSSSFDNANYPLYAARGCMGVVQNITCAPADTGLKTLLSISGLCRGRQYGTLTNTVLSPASGVDGNDNSRWN